MTEVIPLAEQIKAKHPTSGLPVTVVGVKASPNSFDLELVVLHRGPRGIYAETVSHVDEVTPVS